MLYIFDKDGTIIASHGNRPANTIEEQRLLPGVTRKCAKLRAQGHTLAVASNQGGVAWGFITEQDAIELVMHAASLIGTAGARMCPHHPKGNNEYAITCKCRKPAPGMLLSLMEQFGTSPDETIYVGDMDSDRQAAEAAGVTFIHTSEFFKEE
jgi:D-glycero-D-manno-heptose 1,7-bisphosphate phosphatase